MSFTVIPCGHEPAPPILPHQPYGPDSRSSSAVDLLKTFFEHTNEQVYICTFPNERDDPKQAGERRVHTRLPS